jgi:hypothetical protein
MDEEIRQIRSGRKRSRTRWPWKYVENAKRGVEHLGMELRYRARIGKMEWLEGVKEREVSEKEIEDFWEEEMGFGRLFVDDDGTDDGGADDDGTNDDGTDDDGIDEM